MESELINMPWYVKLALALGGAALAWKLAKSGAKKATKSLVKSILSKSPALRKFAISHAKNIDDIINEIEAGVEEAISEELDKDKPKDPSEATPEN